MNLNSYQQEAYKFAQYPEDYKEYLSVAIMGECGEVCNVYKKELRDGVARTEKMIDEIGDIFWYIAAYCTEDGLQLQEIYERAIRPTTQYERSTFSILVELVYRAQDLAYKGILRVALRTFQFAAIIESCLQVMGNYNIELDEVLEYNLHKLKMRLERDEIKDHD